MWQFNNRDPVFVQIANRLRGDILGGKYKEDCQIPSVRQIANDASVNPNTVQRAYTYLEEQGLICSVPKKGAYVTGDVPAENGEQENPAVNALLSLKNQGVRKESVLAALKEVYPDD